MIKIKSILSIPNAICYVISTWCIYSFFSGGHEDPFKVLVTVFMCGGTFFILSQINLLTRYTKIEDSIAGAVMVFSLCLVAYSFSESHGDKDGAYLLYSMGISFLWPFVHGLLNAIDAKIPKIEASSLSPIRLLLLPFKYCYGKTFGYVNSKIQYIEDTIRDEEEGEDTLKNVRSYGSWLYMRTIAFGLFVLVQPLCLSMMFTKLPDEKRFALITWQHYPMVLTCFTILIAFLLLRIIDQRKIIKYIGLRVDELSS